jgi:hypothetical protein
MNDFGGGSEMVMSGGDCDGSGYTDIDTGDFVGITLEIDGSPPLAVDNQIVRAWDFGTVEYCVDENGSGGPPQDTGDADGKCDIDGETLIENAFKTPSTWGTPTYDCIASDFDDAIVDDDILAAGRCGPSARSSTTTGTSEPNFDNFACGDFTP